MQNVEAKISDFLKNLGPFGALFDLNFLYKTGVQIDIFPLVIPKIFTNYDSNFCIRGSCRAALDRAGPPRPRSALESGLSGQAPNLG